MSLQMKTVRDERQQLADNCFLQSTSAAEGAMQNVQSKIIQMDHVLDRSDDDNIFSENPQSDFFHQMETEQWGLLELEAEHDPHVQYEQDKQKSAQIQHEDPQMPTSLCFSEETIPALNQENMVLKLEHQNAKIDLQVEELGADHTGCMEKINNIIQKINATGSTVKSLLSEVLSLEGQVEKLDSHQDLDPDQEASIQAGACNEAHKLKEKFTERVEDATLMAKYQVQEWKTDSRGTGELESQLSQSSPPTLVEDCPPHYTVWKHALRIFVMFYVLTFIGLSCYVLFFDSTFLFEKMLPRMLGLRKMWEIREIITPFLHLEVEDLLPS